ncbi:MAG: hypothetical protein D6813_14710 [Calditrichaeota bacterium]|nr:MAG: hypothetical protein D6813_14710 [Calditrichota bacterium]
MRQDKIKGALSIGQKFELMVTILKGYPIRQILDSYDTKQLVEAHQFLWDKMVEIHYMTQDREFVREEVTRKMTPSAVYQRQQGCDLRIDYCKGVECIWSNPICAGNKVKNNMEVMAQTIVEYISNSKTQNIENKKQVTSWL